MKYYIGAMSVSAAVLITGLLLISNGTASYSRPTISEAANRLMAEHMQLHHRIDKNMTAQEDMIGRIISILENIMKVKERKSK